MGAIMKDVIEGIDTKDWLIWMEEDDVTSTTLCD
jgi:hypothetical protein